MRATTIAMNAATQIQRGSPVRVSSAGKRAAAAAVAGAAGSPVDGVPVGAGPVEAPAGAAAGLAVGAGVGLAACAGVGLPAGAGVGLAPRAGAPATGSLAVSRGTTVAIVLRSWAR